VTGDAEWSNYVVEADITLGTSDQVHRNAGIMWYVSDPRSGSDAYNGYYFGIAPGHYYVSRAKQNNTPIRNNVPHSFGEGTHTLTVVAQNNKFLCYVDGELITSFSDNAYSAGQIGFRSYNRAFSADNVKIRQMTAKEKADLAAFTPEPENITVSAVTAEKVVQVKYPKVASATSTRIVYGTQSGNYTNSIEDLPHYPGVNKLAFSVPENGTYYAKLYMLDGDTLVAQSNEITVTTGYVEDVTAEKNGMLNTLAAAKTMDTSSFTADSLARLNTAIAEAEAVALADTAHQMDYRLAKEMLMVAMDRPDSSYPAERPYEHVVILGLDGAGCLYDAQTPNIDKLMANGASTMDCLVYYPTISAVNWVSMLNGVTYWEHGLNNDNITPGPYASEKYPSIFKVVRDAWPEAVLSSYCNWASPNTGAIEDDIGVNKKNFWYSEGADYEDAKMTEEAVAHIAEASPNLFFMQFDSIDASGHTDGHDTDAQRAQITKVDGYVGQILDAIDANPKMKDNTLVIVSADHGGDGKGHGLYLDNSRKVFYVVAGKGVNHTDELGTMYLRDTPAIVAYALGVKGNPYWDSYVPKNMFTDDMTPSARPAVREQATSATPSKSSKKYIGNYTDLNNLKAGYFFDADLTDIAGKTTAETIGLVPYFDGYYGNSAHLSSDGYISIKDLAFGSDSFSIALWVKRKPMDDTDPPLYGNKDWNRGANQGFTFALYDGNNRNSTIALADGTNRSNLIQPATGDGQMDQWVHTLLVVDRTAQKAYCYENFKKISEADISKVGSLDSVYDFSLGRSGPDTYKRVPDALVDDLLIFNNAVTAQEIDRLAAYYGVVEEDYETPSANEDEYIGNFVNLSDLKAGYFFDDKLEDITGKTNATVAGAGVTYADGYFGNAARASSANYITIGEGDAMKNLEFAGADGMDSFSIALWVKRNYSETNDLPIYGNKNWKSGKNKGIVFALHNNSFNGTIIVCPADGTNRVSGDLSNKTNQNHALSSEWVHTVAVVNRSTQTASLYENFELTKEINISTIGSLNSDLPFTIGRSGGVYTDNGRTDNTTILLDDLLIFGKAIGSSEIHALQSYYNQAKTHNWNTEYTIDVPATCAAAGSKSIRCKDCNVQKGGSVTVIPATGKHTEGAPEVVTPATPTAPGLAVVKCSVCGQELSRVDIPATGEAKIGEQTFATLEEALAVAAAGQTVNLNKDVSAEYITVDPSVTLDLNGHTLETDYVIGFKGSVIGGEGKLIVNKDKVALDKNNGGFLPVYEEDGYIFVNVNLENRTAMISEKQFAFSPVFDTEAHEALLAGSAVSGIKVVVRLNWEKADNYKAVQDFTYVDEMVKTVIESYDETKANYGEMFIAEFAGTEAAGAEGVTVSAVIISDTGVEIQSAVTEF